MVDDQLSYAHVSRPLWRERLQVVVIYVPIREFYVFIVCFALDFGDSLHEALSIIYYERGWKCLV
jgi:hypothetical protein